MTTFRIKLIAITSMVIDHVGLFFFPHILVFRIVGRLAFPLFAWLIANGAYYSKNIKAYLARLFFFALVAQIPFICINRLNDPSFWELNVLFTLFLGLLAIALMRNSANTPISLLIVMIIAGLASILNTEYSAMGILAIVSFYLSLQNVKKMIILQIFIFCFFSIAAILFVVATTGTVNPATPSILLNLCSQGHPSMCFKLSVMLPPNFIASNLIEPLGLFSLFFIAAYRNQEGSKMKYFFYWFYPIHLLLLYFITLFVY